MDVRSRERQQNTLLCVDGSSHSPLGRDETSLSAILEQFAPLRLLLFYTNPEEERQTCTESLKQMDRYWNRGVPLCKLLSI